MKPMQLIAGLAFAIAGATALPSQAGVRLDIDIAPPAPREEVVPAARPGYVWAPGYWDYDGHQHVWRGGQWVHERHGQHWVADRWDQHEGHYRRVPGHWEHG
ncbi:MAG: hypothetical protein JWR16_290 [Nevskia sp.]|nr:hypothetical protein [Nevskia sp.]